MGFFVLPHGNRNHSSSAPVFGVSFFRGPPACVADLSNSLSDCVIVSVDVRDWKEPAPPAPADTGAPVWTTGLGNNASVWMASLANSVRNVSICL